MTDTSPQVETIQVDMLEQANRTSHARWSPHVGPETTALFQSLLERKKLTEEGREHVQSQALKILARCIPPKTLGEHETGLVIGYVQSGKTMSITALTALARDNGFPLVIMLTGTSVVLFDQSKERLKKDLNVTHDSRPNRNFLFQDNPRGLTTVQTLRRTLEVWSDTSASTSDKRTVVLPVMKNVQHLRAAAQVLRSLSDLLALMPVLVIDDEADQASLNTKVGRDGQSPTYKTILDLREALPQHSYLQYTATPQAPLLIDVLDTLSPNFAQVLIPGAGYTGGQTFFQLSPQLVLTIPEDELPTRDGSPDEVPDTLMEALRFFYLGVATAFVQNESPDKNRSMMVHPAVKKEMHRDYHRWVTKVSEDWQRMLRLPEADPDRQMLLSEFKVGYHELTRTVPLLPSFAEVKPHILRAIQQTRIVEINTREKTHTPNIDWQQNYAYILVGGAALDRGFTVEGLTVSYMPREAGVGNADTLQQRARFFGYKGGYLGFCRVYLPQSMLEQYRAYVDHEEDVRTQMAELMAQGAPLNTWKRAFLLDRTLRPTRASVLSLDGDQVRGAAGWFALKRPHSPLEQLETYRSVVRNFLDQYTWAEHRSDPRNNAEQTQLRTVLPLETVYQELLVPLLLERREERITTTALLLQLSFALSENPDLECVLFQMSSGTLRERKINEQDAVPNLFQGKNQRTGFPGDRAIREMERVTVQIHRLTIPNFHTTQGVRELSDVYAVGVYAPFGHDVYIQEEGDG